MPTFARLAVLLGLSACGPSGPTVSPPTEWALSWADEFDGAAGTLPDASRWVLQTGTGPNGDGWGNNELQTYTARPENVAHDGEGHLVITARRERFGNRDYTSARINTQGLFTQTYGRLEARIKVPAAKGLWPAFWALGADITEVGWPRCGEIDVLEVRGHQPSSVIASLHGPEYFGGGAISKRFTLEGGTFADDFHVFAAEWDPSRIAFSVDGEVFQTVTARSVVGGGRTWVFDDPFFLILNLAVGGTFLTPTGQPDANTVFPQALTVDFVRAYTRVPAR
ncbi:MAG: glycoside hydrolase family 16 protein [Myxococcaceae bacterium]|nr:glycoside hydrolase family 16 protein [Myxococcaceae bacterium]